MMRSWTSASESWTVPDPSRVARIWVLSASRPSEASLAASDWLFAARAVLTIASCVSMPSRLAETFATVSAAAAQRRRPQDVDRPELRLERRQVVRAGR